MSNDNPAADSKPTAITIRHATSGDVGLIEQVEASALEGQPAEWYVPDGEPFVTRHLSHDRFTIVAETENNQIVGFLLIDRPGAVDKNLGHDIGLPADELTFVAHMESIAVLPHWRHQGIMERLIHAGLDKLAEDGDTNWALCTVAPHNIGSLTGFTSCGFTVLAHRPKFGGLDRYILGCRVGTMSNLPTESSSYKLHDTPSVFIAAQATPNVAVTPAHSSAQSALPAVQPVAAKHL